MDFWTREDTGDRINGRKNKTLNIIILMIIAEPEECNTNYSILI
jgi:hypothetical protein